MARRDTQKIFDKLPIHRKCLLEKMYLRGDTMAAICKEFGKHRKDVQSYLTQAGIQRRPAGRPSSKGREDGGNFAGTAN